MSDRLEPDEHHRLTRRAFLGSSFAALGGTVLTAGDAEAVKRPKPDLALATLTDKGFLASIGTTAPAWVRIEAWPKGSHDEAKRSRWVRTRNANVAKIQMMGVGSPGDAIRWRPFAKSRGPDGHIVRGEVHELPARPEPGQASKFSFAFGCCITQGRPAPALDVARRSDPAFFAMLGDLGYLDNVEQHPAVQTYKGYSKLFRRMLSKREMGELVRETPLFAVQDDHDYGLDDCWRDTIKPYAARAFADLVPGAVWPGPNYRRWSIGEVDFFLTDNRRFKDPPNGPYENGRYMSVLGAQQREWLLSALSSSSASVKVVFIPQTLTWYWSPGEANEVLSRIRQNVSGRVIFLSGDKHAGAFIQDPGDIWEMLAGPIENTTKHLTPARPNVVWTENGTDRALYDVVGVVDIDTLETMSITLRLMRDDGQELHRETFPVAPQVPVVKRHTSGLSDRNALPNTPLTYGSLTPNPKALVNNQRVPGRHGYVTDGSPPKYWLISTVVINVGWHQLQDDAHTGSDIIGGNIVDQILDDIRSLNAEDPGLDMKASLRVYSGIRVPDHIRTIAPGPMLVKNNDGKENFIAPFWVPQFSDAYAALQRGLSARYDGDPLITGTDMSQCAMFYTECYIRNLGTPGNPDDLMADGRTTGQRLGDAGYSDENNDAALLQMFQAHDVWQSTPSICAFNPYPKFNTATGGSAGTDIGKTSAHMDLVRAILGQRAVLANYSIRRNNQPAPYGPVGGPAPFGAYMAMYQHMVDLGEPIRLQTAAPENLCQNPTDTSGDCWDDPKETGGVLDWATSYDPDASIAGNAICVELANVWGTQYDPDTLRTFSDRLRAQTY